VVTCARELFCTTPRLHSLLFARFCCGVMRTCFAILFLLFCDRLACERDTKPLFVVFRLCRSQKLEPGTTMLCVVAQVTPIDVLLHLANGLTGRVSAANVADVVTRQYQRALARVAADESDDDDDDDDDSSSPDEPTFASDESSDEQNSDAMADSSSNDHSDVNSDDADNSSDASSLDAASQRSDESADDANNNNSSSDDDDIDVR
jgi:hypothetical protein